jgi:hypothetical protein
MTEDQWARERADVIDGEATEIAPPASHTLPNGKQNNLDREDK